MNRTLWTVGLIAVMVLCAGADDAEPPLPGLESETPEPGLAYGPAGDLALPRTILFSAGPEEIIEDAAEWKERGIHAFFLDFIAREWSSDIWARDGQPWTIGESDATFQLAKQANAVCRELGMETFLKIAFDRHFEWFNDLMWDRLYHNFHHFAVFAREAGCAGIALDIEYVGEQYAYDWEGYDYDGYTREDLARTVQERMTKALAVLYDAFPGMVFLTFPEQGFNLGALIHAAWIEEAARRNAPGGFHYCTEWTYRNPNIRYMFAHAWAYNAFFDRLLSDAGRRYWREHGTIAAGIWPFGFDYQTVHDPGMPLDAFRQGYAAALMMSARYNWIYSHQSRGMLLGRSLDEYAGSADLPAYLDVIEKREIVTDTKYLALARELRAMSLRDYSEDLGLVPTPNFAGPQDVPALGRAPMGMYPPGDIARNWELSLDYLRGAPVDLKQAFQTQTDWWVIGPFPSPDHLAAHNMVFPPERELDLDVQYAGAAGPVRWTRYESAQPGRASVDLVPLFTPHEHVAAYALCYVTSPREQQVQFRIGTNDAGKLWLGGELVYSHPHEGTAILDRDTIAVTLPAGTTPILVKIVNGVNQWGFVFRVTDTQGRAVPGLAFTLKPAS